ncbi:MAG: YbaB/EbfC family nucleoid-associated protein [Pseudonocardiaceae bacterium]|nr:YbaB/EbfC family nucleoid-associated protein [Pseudonocardiaceae bacterium]
MSSVDDWLRQAEEQRAQALEEAADLRTVVASTRGSARSADGLVSAVVAPGGALVSLELDERVMERTVLSLQQSIVDTIHRASADAAARLEAAVRPLVGERYDDAMAAAQSQMPDIPGLPGRAEHEDDDLSQHNVFGGK